MSMAMQKSFDVGDTFELTGDHLALLRAAWWRWEQVEQGAPAIDPKRPYGNSDVATDVIEILGWPEPAEDEQPPEATIKRALWLHAETLAALEVICHVGAAIPGTYRKVERAIGSHTSSCWEPVDLPRTVSIPDEVAARFLRHDDTHDDRGLLKEQLSLGGWTRPQREPERPDIDQHTAAGH